MAIKTPENYDSMTINVHLKNGTEFIGKDIPQVPLGDSERNVSFWNENKVLCYPMSQVEHIEYLFAGDVTNEK